MTTSAPTKIDALRAAIRELHQGYSALMWRADDGVHRELLDGGEWRTSGPGQKPWLVRFPERYDTAALRAALYAKDSAAAAAWSARCPRCQGQKVPGTRCIGADACAEGDDGGGPAECCADWGSRCCACGFSFGVGQ